MHTTDILASLPPHTQANPQFPTFGSTALVLAYSKNSQFLEKNQVIVTLPGCLI